MSATFLVVAGLCLGGLATRMTYEARKRTGRVDTRSKAVFAAVFAAMVIMLGSWPALAALDPWRVAIPGAVRAAGLGLVAVALGLVFGGLAQLRGLETIDHLVTTGLYSRLRHPMYAGFVLWIVGWVVCGGALASLAVALPCIGGILSWRRAEERALEARYGEAYRRYRETVPRWLPRRPRQSR